MSETRIQEIVRETMERHQSMRSQTRGLETVNPEAVADTVATNQAQAAEGAALENAQADGVDEQDVRAEVERQVRDALQAHRTMPVSNIEDARAPGREIDQHAIRSMLSVRSKSENIQELQDAHCDLQWAREIFGGIARQQGAAPMQFPGMVARLGAALQSLGFRDITTTGVATGNEWAYDEPGTVPIPRMSLIAGLGRIFPQFEIPRGRETLKLNGVAGRATIYTVGEGSAITESTPGTRNVTFQSTSQHAALTQVTQQADEMLSVPALQFARDQIIEGLALAVDQTIISGDVNSGLDSDQAAGDVYAKWDGFRHKCLSDLANTAGVSRDLNAAATAGDVRLLRGDMGIYGVNPTDLAIIMGVLHYATWLDDADMKTLDVIGNRATILTGSYDQVQGVPVLVSEGFREDLNAAGAYDGVTVDNHGYLVVNKKAWGFAMAREILIETDKEITTQLWDVVGTVRRDFKHLYADATVTDTTAAYGYNIDN